MAINAPLKPGSDTAEGERGKRSEKEMERVGRDGARKTKAENRGMTRERERGNERPRGVETEVSCLRRRLAEEDRGRGKKCLSCVCLCAEGSIRTGSRRAYMGAVVRAWMCQRRWSHSLVLPQETSAVTEVRVQD